MSEPALDDDQGAADAGDDKTSSEAAGWATSVVIHVRAGRPSDAALAAAIAVARSLEVDVRGHYVEDEGLLSLAALPCAREVTIGGRRPAVMTFARLETDMNLASTALRRDLLRRAAEAGVPMQCDVVRGDPDQALAGVCARHALIALTEPYGLAETALLPRLHSEGQVSAVLVCGPHAWQSEGPIVVLVAATPGINRLMEAAAGLQDPDGRDLIILTLGLDRAETALLTTAARIATGYDTTVRILAVEARQGSGMVAETTRRLDAGLVLASWDAADGANLTALVTALDCPLLLLR